MASGSVSSATDRADREVANLAAVMGEPERTIREVLDDRQAPRLPFDWTVEEKAQRESDLGSLTARLAEIPAELERDAAHLRARYEDRYPRLFPVAVTFLVPRNFGVRQAPAAFRNEERDELKERQRSAALQDASARFARSSA